jgi:DNA-binding transcriptional regulator YdaS (Cro superfamily)
MYRKEEKSMTPQEALQKVIKIIGGQTTLARHLGITYQSVHGWATCPADRVLDLERLTEAQVTRYQLRPDVFTRAA